MIKKRIPVSLKIKAHLFKNFLSNVYKGYSFRFAKKASHSEFDFNHSIEITQEIKNTESSRAKKLNFKTAIDSIEEYIIKPNEVFSFWGAVGNPTSKRGYVKSRSIVDGVLEESIGGGLCQISGLIYYSCILANIDVLERYNHTADIYTEETRFTPLGSDATVVYGYKDLKIRNSLKHPIVFGFSLTETEITIQLKSLEAIDKQRITFKKTTLKNKKIEVLTFINEQEYDRSVYNILH